MAAGGDSTAGAAPRRKRRPFRRDQILDAAIKLFHEHGYHATGMDDIGAAAGITGPGIYRHFKSKEDILETALHRRSDPSTGRIGDIVGGGQPPIERLGMLVENFVDGLLVFPELSAVVITERRVLPVVTCAMFDRAEHDHLLEWVHALQEVRPDISDSEARFLVQATAGMIVSYSRYRTDLSTKRVGEVLRGMAMAAMLSDPSEACQIKKRAAVPAAGRARGRE